MNLCDTAYWFTGQARAWPSPDFQGINQGMWYYNAMGGMMSAWSLHYHVDLYVDLVEVCGGKEKTSQIIVRRMHREGVKRGLSFDLVCGVDLPLPQEREWIKK